MCHLSMFASVCWGSLSDSVKASIAKYGIGYLPIVVMKTSAIGSAAKHQQQLPPVVTSVTKVRGLQVM